MIQIPSRVWCKVYKDIKRQKVEMSYVLINFNFLLNATH